ncbi:putative group-specific protein [Enterobacter hormaechei]|nr:putative group-specific protein [Enterobacter hormaechei]
MHYQEYVPDGWQGELVDFCSNGSLPQDEIFWIKNETDHRSVLIAKG